MPRRNLCSVVLAALAALPALAAAASNCDTIRAQIEAKLHAGGLSSFTLEVMDTDAPSRGKVLGSCERGTKKIVQVGAAVAAASSAPRPAREPILTECKDGRVLVGGDCRR